MTLLARRLICLLLLTALFCQPAFALGEESAPADEPDALSSGYDAGAGLERYTAKPSVALKVRRGPGTEYGSFASVAKGEAVYIYELGVDWARIRYNDTSGYVLTKYLEDIREYDPATAGVGDTVISPLEIVDYSVGSTDDFKQGYKAETVKSAVIYTEPDTKSRFVIKVPMYKTVIISHIAGDWCYAKYNNKTGWIQLSDLFKWDRLDPYIGDIPGCITYPLLVFVNHTTDVLDYKTRLSGGKKDNVLQSVNPGGCLAVERPDEEGRYKTPYWRVTGFICEEDIAYTMEVVPYDQARPGDLISAYTSYYAVGIKTLNYQGRNWNIYLSTAKISGTVLQPNEVFNVNQVMGPYRQSTGYKRAPIMKKDALWGYGGGTCQVNTTLYNTLIRLPILVNYRVVHANVGIKYMLKGFDAAVGGGDINMIFTNTLPYPIRINFLISDGILTCAIFRA